MELILEFFLQLVIELLVEGGFHAMGRAADPRPGPPAWGATFAYLVLGLCFGLVSLWIFPELFVRPTWLRVANLVVTPLLVGGAMALLGSWRRRRGHPLVRLDRFTYAYAFALVIAVVRFTWGR